MRISLLITCLADTFYPQVGIATVGLLRRLGVEVDFPRAQTCCGQPAFNAGFPDEARAVACRMIAALEPAEAIVCPSGSCSAMVKVFYMELFRDDPKWNARAASLAAKTYELSEFIVTVLGRDDISAKLKTRVTYHDGCHMLRGLGIADAPRRLLRAVRDLELVELETQICCGFGGTFSVDYSDISSSMLEDKLGAINATGAEYVVSGDSSCLMQISGGLARQGSAIRTLHLAELLMRGLEHAG
jgi:L-lactate dehydrogenase complex protein LldE